MARKSRVATVYMQVAPSMDGFFTKITRDVNAGMPNVGKKAGGSLGSSLASGAGKAFTTAWKALKIGTLVTAGIAGGLATAFAATTLKGGISRALNIEDAQATLKGLGYQVDQIKGITDDVLASVRGTAFALDDAMTIAASALAAGVPQGQGLTDYLKLIADTATITKSDLGEIGSIFNRVKASGRAFTLELNMLADRGLPVFSWLQEEFGVTAEELRKMVAAGEVDAGTFAKVLEENIGGAALTSADTTSGALANVQAAMSRLGAVVAGGSLPVVKDMLVAFIPALDAFAEALTPIAEEFWATFGPKATAGFKGFLDYVLGFIDGTKQLPAPLQLAFAMFQNFGTVVKEVYGFIAPLIPLLVTLAQTVGSLLTPIFEQLSGFVKANAAEFSIFGSQIVSVFKELGPSLNTVIPTLSNLLNIFGNLLSTVMPILPALLSLAVTITNILMPALQVVTFLLQEFSRWVKDVSVWFFPLTGAVLAFVGAIRAAMFIQAFISSFQLLSGLFLLGRGRIVLTTAAIIANTAAKIKNKAVSMGETIALASMYLWDNVKALAASTAEWIKNTASKIGNKAVSVAETIALASMYLWDNVKALAASTAGWVKNTAATVANRIANSAIISELKKAPAVLLWVAKALGTMTLGLIRNAAAWVASTAGMVAARVAGLATAAWMGIVTAAQWAWNAALLANPIGLIIAGIAALVAGLIWFFTQTKLGQDIWKNLTKFIGESINNIGKWLGDVGRNIGNFFAGIGNAFANMFKGLANFFIGVINNQINAVNWLIGLINSIQIPIPEFARGLFGGARNIGFNIGKIANIPALATGANVMGPTVALVGEKRPETVTDLGLTNRFISNTNKLVEAQLGQNPAQAPIINNVTVEAGNVSDPYELTRLITKELSKQQRR